MLTFHKKMKQACTALSVWNVVKDHLAFQVTNVLLPESECKGRAFFRTAKLLQKKFSKKIKHFLDIAHFQSVIKSTKIREKRGVLKPYCFGLKIQPHIRHEESA